MFIFGHLGIGYRIAKPLANLREKDDDRPGLPTGWVLFGTLLPDVIDKPLFYGLRWLDFHVGIDFGFLNDLISGTRTFGHTALFVLILGLIGFFTSSKLFSALALGVSTHLFLDQISGLLDPYYEGSTTPGYVGLLFPFFGVNFPDYPFHSMTEHAAKLSSTSNILFESLGVFILYYEFWKNKNLKAILSNRKEFLVSIRRRRRQFIKRIQGR